MPNATIEEAKFFADTRGLVIEPLDPERLPHQLNCHVVLTAPGAIRGNHFHENSTEIAVVVGPALVRLREKGEIRDVQVANGQAFRFTLPPQVSHAFQNTGAQPLLVMAFNTAVFDRQKPDVVPDILI